MSNLTSILDSTEIALEKQASDAFGAAVEDFSRGMIAPSLGLSPPAAQGSRDDRSFYASSYAAALAGGTSYRPKMKFLFKVEFVFTPEAQAEFRGTLGSTSSNDFTFMVKAVDRPKIDFEYDDDVNMYNFRTKVLKKIRHRELTITFMDDIGNRVLDFFRVLMMIHSPITRRQLEREALDLPQKLAPPDVNSVSMGNGMAFTEVSDRSLNDIAIRGTVHSQVGNIIQTIRVKQIYVNPSSHLSSAVEEVIFDFLNARLVSFDLDDLNHETSDVNLMTMQFDYDWMEIIKVGPLQVTDSPIYNIAVPGVNGAPTDITPNGGVGQSNAQGSGNTFANMTSEAIYREVESIAGNGYFAGLLGSQFSSILGGVVGAAGRSLASGIANPLFNQGTAVFGDVRNLITGPNSPIGSMTSVFDSALGGSADLLAVITKEGW